MSKSRANSRTFGLNFAVAPLRWAQPNPSDRRSEAPRRGIAQALHATNEPFPGAVARIPCRRARDPFAHLDDLPGYAALYAAGTDLDDPLASPVHGDYRGMPPLLVQIGSEETLYDDAIAVAGAADAAGVDVRVEEWTGMFHTWHAHVGKVTGADDAIASAATFLRRTLG